MRAVVALSSILVASCSLGVPQPDACQSTAECRAAFGAGTYCDLEGGRCESVTEGTPCPELYPPEAASDPAALLIGTILDRSSENQLTRERSMRLAADGFAGGVEGRRVALLHCDAADAAGASDFLVNQVGVQAILGPSSSRDVEAVFTSHRDAGVLVMSPSATAVQLEALDTGPNPGLLWRTAPPDSLQAAVVLEELGTARVSVVARQNENYAQGLSVVLQEAASTSTELTIVEAAQYGDVDMIGAAATRALGGGEAPEVVIFLSSRVADAARFLDEVAAIPRYDGVRIMLTDAAANDELLRLTADSAGSGRWGQVTATRPSTPDTIVTSEFVAAYEVDNDGQNPLQFSFTAHAYDAAALVLLGAGYAARDGGEITGRRIAEGLTRVTSGASRQLLPANFGSIVSELQGGATVNVVGASGELDFDPATEELTGASYDVLTISGEGTDARFTIARTVSVPPA